jgi:excisionase family DNA binding protein
MEFGPDQLMNTRELADYLRINPATVYRWRHSKEGPPPTRLGSKAVRYRRRDVDAWLEAGQQEPSPEASPRRPRKRLAASSRP